MRRFALAATIVVASSSVAGANGRPPATSTIHWQQGAEQNVLAGLTFGAIISHDSGATWHWTCEKAIGYGGMYDPVYEYTASGAVFATTFGGLKVNRDGCTYNSYPAMTPPGALFIATIGMGSDGALYYGASDNSTMPPVSDVCKSADDGMSFPTCAQPGMPGDWWSSLVVSPKDATRIYLAGYRFVKVCDANSTNAGATCGSNADCTGTNAMCETQKLMLLFKSVNGGTSYTAMATTGLTYNPNSIMTLYADPNNANTLYALITLEDNMQGDGVFVSTNAGASWTKIFEKTESVWFVPRRNGQLVAGTQGSGVWMAPSGSTTFAQLTGAPHVNCLYENSAGEVWACTQNYGMVGVNADGYGIMKSVDLTSWTGVLKFQDITAPIDCAASTVQEQQCVNSYQGMPSVWCCLEAQLGITSTAIDCSQPPMACSSGAVDGAPDAGSNTHVTPPGKSGCCDTGDAGAPGALVLASAIGVILLRRRRKEM